MANMALALRRMLEDISQLGDCSFRDVYFAEDEDWCKELPATTWADLEDELFVEPCGTLNSRECRLTGYGWLEALRAAGIVEKTKREAGPVMAELKKRVDGRREPAFASSEEIAAAAGVSVPFMHNLLDSDFITVVLRRHSVLLEDAHYMTIPVNFGHELL